MTFIGFITREMIHTQNLNMMGPCGTKIKLPLKGLDSMDLYTIVMYNEETNEVLMEPFKQKKLRYAQGSDYSRWMKEDYANKPIINE